MSKHKQFAKASFPLTPAIFYILLSLSIKQRHGYDIMKQVEKDSLGKVHLGPGTLYGAIKRMVEEKLLTEVKNENTRRRYYKITEKGMSIFMSELERYNEAVQLARQKNLLTRPIIARYGLSYV